MNRELSGSSEAAKMLSWSMLLSTLATVRGLREVKSAREPICYFKESFPGNYLSQVLIKATVFDSMAWSVEFPSPSFSSKFVRMG